MTSKLSNICFYAKGKVAVKSLTKANYISTENMLPNRGGVVNATTLPTIEDTQGYCVGDVLVSNIRPYFKKIWFADSNGGCSNDVLVFRAKEGVDARYLYYVLADDSFFNYSNATSKGTKMPRGDKSAIMDYIIEEHSLIEQHRIADILSALDKKIANNNAINDNLQQQAQALFKAWFVDNCDSPNWGIGCFSDYIEAVRSGDWGKELPNGSYTEQVFCIRGADIPDIKNGNKGKMPTRYIQSKNLSSKKLSDGDIIVEISGGSPTQSTGRIAPIHDALINRYNGDMICTNFCKAITPKLHTSAFVYYYWQYLYDKGVLFSYENGTTGIKNLDIMRFIESEQILTPPMSLIEKFDAICRKSFDCIAQNGLESERLTALRDTLLPKLMSGEIDVSDVDI